jgi:hypothetical protein
MRILVGFFAILFVLVGIFIASYSLIDGFFEYDSSEFNIEANAQVGDFVGGVVGTLFALAGTAIIYLSFNQQITQNKREAFESAFFEMLHLHSENVSQLNYTKFEGGGFHKATHRKVFREICREFSECHLELKEFLEENKHTNFILPEYYNYIDALRKKSDLKFDVSEFAIVDITYGILYYGVGKEGRVILEHNFEEKYDKNFYQNILNYISIKPKKEVSARWSIWKDYIELQGRRIGKSKSTYEAFIASDPYKKLFSNEAALELEYVKYYGGHQHRLGHYFRHLFQMFKYLDSHANLSDDEKYFYAKTLRAQLSTYEQLLLFVNSLSSIGFKWEFATDVNKYLGIVPVDGSKLITKYALIKNLPGKYFSGLVYKAYYPSIKYESEEIVWKQK